MHTAARVLHSSAFIMIMTFVTRSQQYLRKIGSSQAKINYCRVHAQVEAKINIMLMVLNLLTLHAL